MDDHKIDKELLRTLFSHIFAQAEDLRCWYDLGLENIRAFILRCLSMNMSKTTASVEDYGHSTHLITAL